MKHIMHLTLCTLFLFIGTGCGSDGSDPQPPAVTPQTYTLKGTLPNADASWAVLVENQAATISGLEWSIDLPVAPGQTDAVVSYQIAGEEVATTMVTIDSAP